MSTATPYVEEQAIPKQSSLIDNLMDFSFQRMATPRMLKMLYSLHLLLGLIVATGFVFNGFKTSTLDGLLALILGVAGLFFWIVYCRIVVETLAMLFRVADAIANLQN